MFELSLSFAEASLAFALEVGCAEAVLGLGEFGVHADCLLELGDGGLREAGFGVGAAEVKMEGSLVTEAGEHLGEDGLRILEIVFGEVGGCERETLAVPGIEGESCLKLLASFARVLHLEERFPEDEVSLGVLGVVF